MNIKGAMKEFFCSEIGVFLQEKGHVYMLYIRFQTVMAGKRQTKYGRLLKKSHQQISAIKWK